jgi:hypothetical protein
MKELDVDFFSFFAFFHYIILATIFVIDCSNIVTDWNCLNAQLFTVCPLGVTEWIFYTKAISVMGINA